MGNIRLSYTEDPSNPGEPTIIEENNYYPFGLEHKGYNYGGDTSLGNDVAQKWKFGGKEYQDEFDLAWYDVTARNYDPALGRWMNLDPLAEQMRRHSPYNFAFDNPIYFQDYDGMAPTGCCGNTNPIPTYSFRIGMAIYNGLRKIAGMDPIDPTGSAVDRSSADGYTYVTEDGQPSGDPSTVTKTDGNVQEVDVTGLEALTVVAGGKKGGKGDGMTTARDPAKQNGASSFADGVDRASDAGNTADAVDSANGDSTMETGNKSDPDSTFMTTRAGEISTTIVNNKPVSYGDVTKVEVTVPASKTDSVIRTDQASLDKQMQEMQSRNQQILDSLKRIK